MDARAASQAQVLSRPAPGVWGEFGYLDAAGGSTVVYMYENGVESQPQARFRMVRKYVEDMRLHTGPRRPRLDVEGFELVQAPSAVGDFWLESEVRRIYYPEVQELALLLTGGSRAMVFDHVCRKREEGRPALSFGRSGDGSRPAAVGRVHNDYSERSGEARLAKVLKDDQAMAPSSAYCIVNIWRPIVGPVADTPLAVCDAGTVQVGDLHACSIHYPDRTGEIYAFTDSPHHRWRYCSAMQRGEALVFKQYDSRVNGVSRFVPHAAFDLPDRDPDAALRQSIEVRCLVMFE